VKAVDMSQHKVFVIGLDGATLDLIGPWVEQGHLPALRQMMRQGTSGPLRSTFPPLTGPAWGSFMTGKSPGRHGVLEFFRRQEGTYRQVLNSWHDLDGASIWRLLSDAGRKVGVMGLPMTYPPEPVDGFLIAGLLTPADRRDFTYPPELLDELETHLGHYRLRHDEKYLKSNPDPFLREQYEILENNSQAALYLMAHKPWDFFMVHFLGTDRIQHEFWHVLDPSHPQHDPSERERLGDVILDFFKQVDTAVGRLLAALDDETVVIILSDHGFGPAHKFINFNTWLLQPGLLRLKPAPGTWLRYLLFRVGFNYSVLGRWVLKLGLGRRAKEMGRARRENLQRRLFLSLNDVDWSRSRAYSMGNFGQLYVNLAGREPQGIVSPGSEYEDLLDDLIQRLQALVDPEAGQPVIGRILRPEQVYDGPYTERAPDIMFFTRNMKYKAMGLSDFSSPHIFDPIYGTTGHHRMNGILICHGPGIVKGGAWLEDARIHDLAPTILYLMRQPIPRGMDGRVLLDLFTPEFRQRYEVTTSQVEKSPIGENEPAYSEEEESQIRERLRALGYVT
jgi:predicted AlkP superfamily phosphohydrolase/phosphomutase